MVIYYLKLKMNKIDNSKSNYKKLTAKEAEIAETGGDSFQGHLPASDV